MFGHLIMFQYLFNWKLEYYFPCLLGVANLPVFAPVGDVEIRHSVDVDKQDSEINNGFPQHEAVRSLANYWGRHGDLSAEVSCSSAGGCNPHAEADIEQSHSVIRDGRRTLNIQNTVSS